MKNDLQFNYVYFFYSDEEVFMVASLKNKDFTIKESDAARWLAINVCVNLAGRLTAPVIVQLRTVAGTAQGII